ncbi:MAG: DUF1707 domain-containing protein [Actinomycetota bacterium]|nr:DUF1707 domain-containing protein [Actinomycetota bacterium]
MSAPRDVLRPARATRVVRIGDAERDTAIERLREHHVLGRLDAAEFEQRMGAASQAKSKADLVPLFADLARSSAPRRPRRPRRSLSKRWRVAIVAAALGLGGAVVVGSAAPAYQEAERPAVSVEADPSASLPAPADAYEQLEARQQAERDRLAAAQRAERERLEARLEAEAEDETEDETEDAPG